MVVVKCVVKFLVKFKHCLIETKIGVVVDIDSPITIVVCGKIYGNIYSKKKIVKCVAKLIFFGLEQKLVVKFVVKQ